MTRAVVKLYLNGKFELGAWVSHLGHPNPFLRNILKKVDLENTEKLSQNVWSNILLFANHHTWRWLKVPKKKAAFNNQLNKDKTAKVYSMFWGINLNEFDLYDNGLFGEWEYTIRVNKKNVKIEVKYQGEVFSWEGSYKSLDNSRDDIITQMEEWGIKIDKELADCDCKN
jgi:hypothetical protein